jgi:beta-lactamase superfamily II metal-dependent hydrolase
VGQGDATLVQGARATLLVDAGRALPDGFDAGARVVAPALAALGTARIDRLAVSHADLDHRGGVPAVLERFDVGAVWLPVGGLAEPAFAPLREAARRRGVPVVERGAASPPERIGDLVVTFLGPPVARAFAARNDASLVLRVDVGARSLLLAGDVGAAGEGALRAGGGLAPVDLLLLPHHGSRTSSGAAFLDALAPGLAVVSAPCRGPFPMPHPTVRARLAARGVPLRWTGRDGAVIAGLGDDGRVRRWGAPRRGCFGEGPP